MDVQGADLVFVYQRGALHHGAAQEHGLQVGHRRYRTGAAHLVVDGEDGRAGLFGLEFIRHGPTGALGGEAQLPLDGHLVDLDYNAVRGIGKVLAGGIPMADKVFDFGDAVADLPMFGYRQAPALSSLEGFVVGRVVHLAGRDVVEGAEEASFAYFLRILQFE